ncbi:hypothetical protein JTP77_023895 [Streptomyces sp. S9]|nr:hypothetical protein [Streptomyces sp. S9]
MTRARLAGRMARLEQRSAEAQALGAEVLALVDRFLDEGGDLAELAGLFGLSDGTEGESA